MSRKSAIVIGAGIVGLATARALAVTGHQVTVIERNSYAVGASIRNFGMIWPIGQPDGELYDHAMLSKKIWLELCEEAGLWHEKAGSLHLAYENDELDVLSELSELYRHRGYRLINPAAIAAISEAAVQPGLLGGLYSDQEMIVNPRKAIPAIARWLEDKHGVEFAWNTAATSIIQNDVHAGSEVFSADEIFVCSGADFETLFPEIFASRNITKCKLQMMKIAAQPGNTRIGPALCGGLSLLHYKSFGIASSLPMLKERIEDEFPEYIKYGMHVMVSQNDQGELIIGDSHEYGLTHDPFNREEINYMILNYLDRFASFSENAVVETWNGVYPKLQDGGTNLILSPQPGVTVINGLGGAGMTLSFGLCDQAIRNR